MNWLTGRISAWRLATSSSATLSQVCANSASSESNSHVVSNALRYFCFCQYGENFLCIWRGCVGRRLYFLVIREVLAVTGNAGFVCPDHYDSPASLFFRLCLLSCRVIASHSTTHFERISYIPCRHLGRSVHLLLHGHGKGHYCIYRDDMEHSQARGRVDKLWYEGRPREENQACFVL